MNAAAKLLEICIQQTAIKLSNIAADRGVYVNETEILLAVQQDPRGETAQAFQEMFKAALAGAQQAVTA